MFDRIRKSKLTRLVIGKFRQIERRAQPVEFRRSVYGHDLMGSPSDVTYQFALNGKYGHFIEERIKAQPRDRILLDIGANIGLFSVIGAKHLTGGAVFGFEPNSIVYGYLQQNLAKNGCDNATAFCVAIAPDAPQTITLQVNPQHSGTTSMVNGSGAVAVRASTLNHHLFDAIYETGRSYIAKIDVEGFEPQVLETLFKSALGRHIVEVIVEISEAAYGGQHNQAIIDLLSAQSFVSAHRSSDTLHRDEAFVRRLQA